MLLFDICSNDLLKQLNADEDHDDNAIEENELSDMAWIYHLIYS